MRAVVFRPPYSSQDLKVLSPPGESRGEGSSHPSNNRKYSSLEMPAAFKLLRMIATGTSV